MSLGVIFLTLNPPALSVFFLTFLWIFLILSGLSISFVFVGFGRLGSNATNFGSSMIFVWDIKPSLVKSPWVEALLWRSYYLKILLPFEDKEDFDEVPVCLPLRLISVPLQELAEVRSVFKLVSVRSKLWASSLPNEDTSWILFIKNWTKLRILASPWWSGVYRTESPLQVQQAGKIVQWGSSRLPASSSHSRIRYCGIWNDQILMSVVQSTFLHFGNAAGVCKVLARSSK